MAKKVLSYYAQKSANKSQQRTSNEMKSLKFNAILRFKMRKNLMNI